MKDSLVIIGLSRLASIRDKAKSVPLSDPKEIKLRDELSKFTDILIGFDRSSYTDKQTRLFCQDIECISGWFNALMDTVNTRLSKSILELLKLISKDWINEYDNRVFLVTMGAYATQAYAKIKNERFVNEYSFSFSVLPLILFVPAHLTDDLFLGVALLHEIGHMVDLEWGITLIVDYLINEEAKAGRITVAECGPYFSDLTSNRQPHLREYFADIFGAQYSNESILANVEYRTVELDESSYTHPSYNNRLSAVRDFLTNVTTKKYASKILSVIDMVMDKVIQKPLRTKAVSMDESILPSGQLLTFANNEQLFSIIDHSWIVYEKGPYTLDRYSLLNTTALNSLKDHFSLS